jgi:hypothetical protein
MRTKEEAIVFLTTKEYLLPGKPADLLTLSHILLQLGTAVVRMLKVLTDRIRAVAILMADAAAQHKADEITTIVKIQLQEHMEIFATNIETMRDAAEHVTGAAREITGKMEEINDEFQEKTNQLEQAMQEITEWNTNRTNAPTTTPDRTYQPMTYANAIQQHVPPAHESVVARGKLTVKQIMIQKDPNITNNVLESLTEKDLVAKANTTLDLMGVEAADKLRGTMFVGAKKLKNGNVLYQLNSMDAGHWIKQPDVQKAFVANYGGTSNIQTKLHYVIAEFVPTTYDAGSSYAHAKVEEDSGISGDTIAFSKYIKPPHLRNNHQKVAHIIIGFNDQNAANNTIQAGLFIEGKYVEVRKKLTEPRRCLKCQRYGHYVPDCKASEDTCARCREHHRTATCNVKEMAEL